MHINEEDECFNYTSSPEKSIYKSMSKADTPVRDTHESHHKEMASVKQTPGSIHNEMSTIKHQKEFITIDSSYLRNTLPDPEDVDAQCEESKEFKSELPLDTQGKGESLGAYARRIRLAKQKAVHN